MVDRHWWQGAAWSALCSLCALMLAGGLLAAAGATVLAPFAFIGFLIGPAETFSFGRLVPMVAGWLLLMGSAAVAGSWAWRRARAHYRRSPPGLAAGSSIAAGLLAACLILPSALSLAGLAHLTKPDAKALAAVAPLPSDPAATAEYQTAWLPRAEAGDAYAQFVVGEVLQNGALGQPVQQREARQWLERSAAARDLDGQLSLMIAQREGRLGFRQQFDKSLQVAELVPGLPHWRRVAVELWLAQNPVVVVGAGVTNLQADERWRRHWLEQAALHGSRYAAFELGRALENNRNERSEPAPDADGAARWYAFGMDMGPAARQRSARADSETLGKLQRRSQLVALRQRGQVLSPGTEDARVNFITWLEAAGDYERLVAETRLPPGRFPGDPPRDRNLWPDDRLADYFAAIAAAQAADASRASSAPR